jgi:hypothetical protein
MGYDKEVVKQAATGRWLEILASVCGLTPDQLDPRQHGPCPRCNGTDRYRALDDVAEKGALFCNQCFNKGNGDGFAAVQWITGCDFPTAVEKVAKYLGLEPRNEPATKSNASRKGKSQGDKKDPGEKLTWYDWDSSNVGMFIANKPGVSEAAILAAGGRLASYEIGRRKYLVIAFPIIGPDLDVEHPTGWVVVNAIGKALPRYNHKTKQHEQVKVVVTKDSWGGFVGLSAVNAIKSGQPIERCWKCEGITDLLAILTAIPQDLAGRHIAITNSNGCNQNPGFMASDVLAKLPRVDVVHDADEPGQRGAEKWCDGILNGKTIQNLPGKIFNINLGYDIAPNHGKDIRDRFNEGWTYADLLDVADKTKPCEDIRDTRKPILVTPDEYKMNAVAAAALKDDPTVLQRAGRLVRVISGASDDGIIHRSASQPRIAEIGRAITREILTELCYFYQECGEGGCEERQVNPPMATVNAVHERGEWPGVPPLVGLTFAPVVRADGSILSTCGYDRPTGLYFAGQNVGIDVPNTPTKEDVNVAVDVLLDIVCDFPFESDEHRSAWLAALLTPLARIAFDGPAPLFLIDANTRGTGKTLLADIIGRVVLGAEIARMADPRDEDETRKRITAIASAGDSVVLIDNLGGVFGNPAIEAVLTSTRWQDRILGRSETINLPLFVTWLATGNNVVLSRDMPRRVLHIRLQSPLEQPESRTEFKHSVITEYVAENRGRLLSAALTILRAYFVAGKPKQQLAPWGGYEGWSNIVRGALVHAGLADPAKNRQEFTAASDTEFSAISALLENWSIIDPDASGLTAVDIHAKINSSVERLVGSGGGYVHPGDDQVRALETVRESILELCSWKGSGTPSAKQIAYMLRRIRSRVVGGKKIDCRNGKSHTNIWFVAVSSPSSPPLSPMPQQRAMWKGDEGNTGDYKPLREEGISELHNSCMRTHMPIWERGEISPQSPPSPHGEGHHPGWTDPDSAVEYGGAMAAKH